MSASLDFQAIVDLVGDKLREVFDNGDIGIRWRDESAGLIHYLYEYEHGVRITVPSTPINPDSVVARSMMRREPLVINSRAEAFALGIAVFAGTDPSKSSMFVPIVASDRVLGTIVLENYQRENAYGEAEVRLLRTVASGMGVAIENARLFSETQRLLKETEQRAAELAVINSIQHGMAAELDFKAIVDLVGDKLRELFSFANLGIAWLDEPAGLMHFLYVVELGERLQLAPAQLAVVATGKRYFQALASRQSVVWRDRDEYRALELFVAEGSAMSRSGVTTPIFAGERFLGFIALEDHERDGAFGDADVRLLSTVAASMGVALENARLFDETQRRTRETAALLEVGRDLSSSLDLSTVMDRIAGHAKDLLRASDSAIFLPEPGTTTYRAIVAVGEAAEAIRETAVTGGEGIIGSLLVSGKAEYINDTAADPRGVQIPGTVQASDERLMVVPLGSGGRDRRCDGRLAHGRRPVRRPRARAPDRIVAPGHDCAAERSALRRDAARPRATRRPRPTSCVSSASRRPTRSPCSMQS